MPLLREEAEKLSNNQLISGVITEIIDKDDLFALLPFVKVDGKAYVYNREATLAGADWLDPNEEIKESASTFTEVVAKLRILAGDVDVDKFLMSTMGDTNNQLAIQIAKKAKGVAREFHKALARSTAVGKSFDGMPALVVPEQKIDVTGNALTFSMLDELLDAVPLGADCIVMREGTLRAYRSLLRATYGTDAIMQQLKNFGSGRPVLTHNGVPIIVNNFLETTGDEGNKKCNIYAVRMNEFDGMHGLYGGDNAGIVVETIGTVQNKDAIRTRLKWYCGLALKSTKSIACLKDVANV